MEKVVNPRLSEVADQLTGIGDVRNGLLLDITIHIAQGAGVIYFLLKLTCGLE